MGYVDVTGPGRFSINLDFSLKESLNFIKIKQYESPQLKIIVTNNGTPFNCQSYDNDNDKSIVLRIRRPDKKVIFLEPVLGYDPVVVYPNSNPIYNILYFDILNVSTSVSGYAYCDIVFIKKTQYNESSDNAFDMIQFLGSTQPFIIEIVPAPGLSPGDASTVLINHMGQTSVESVDSIYIDQNRFLHITPVIWHDESSGIIGFQEGIQEPDLQESSSNESNLNE